MTTSRVVRGTKGRIFLYVSAVLIITGVIACYNSTLNQLDEIRKAKDQCHQQQENLSTQLQVIFDYKQKLEKTLKTEKAEHQQNKSDLENKLLEEKAKSEKVAKDADLKFSALQQHFKLLETQHEDFKGECSKTKEDQLHQINDLQRKLQEVQSAFDTLKNKYMQVREEKNALENEIKGTANNHVHAQNEINRLTMENHRIQRDFDKLKGKCELLERDKKSPDKDFSKQVEVEKSVFEILGANQNVGQVDAPESQKDEGMNKSFNNNGEQQINAPMKSSTKMTDLNLKEVSKGSLNGARPLLLPTVTPISAVKSSSLASSNKDQMDSNNVLPLPYANNKLPEGVVPIPNNIEQPQQQKNSNNDNILPEDPKDVLPNRYRNVANENNQNDNNNIKPIPDDKQAQMNDISRNLNLHLDLKDEDNNAVEIFDPINNDNKNDDDPFGPDDNQNDKIVNNKPELQNVVKGKLKFEDAIADYDKNGHDAALEENDEGEDDDGEDYGNRVAHQREPAVRN